MPGFAASYLWLKKTESNRSRAENVCHEFLWRISSHLKKTFFVLGPIAPSPRRVHAYVFPTSHTSLPGYHQIVIDRTIGGKDDGVLGESEALEREHADTSVVLMPFPGPSDGIPSASRSSDGSATYTEPVIPKYYFCQLPDSSSSWPSRPVRENEHNSKNDDSKSPTESEEPEEVTKASVVSTQAYLFRITQTLAALWPLTSECIPYTQGWWSYEYCHMRRVRQLHAYTGKYADHPPLEYVLGQPSATDIFDTRQSMLSISPNYLPTSISAIAAAAAIALVEYDDEGRHYLRLRWHRGTLCEVTGKARHIEVQFHCCNEEHVASVREIAVCNYVMVVHTHRVCELEWFQAAPWVQKRNKQMDSITCRVVVGDQEVDKLKAERGVSKDYQQSEETDAKVPMPYFSASTPSGHDSKSWVNRIELPPQIKGFPMNQHNAANGNSDVVETVYVRHPINDPLSAPVPYTALDLADALDEPNPLQEVFDAVLYLPDLVEGPYPNDGTFTQFNGAGQVEDNPWDHYLDQWDYQDHNHRAEDLLYRRWFYRKFGYDPGPGTVDLHGVENGFAFADDEHVPRFAEENARAIEWLIDHEYPMENVEFDEEGRLEYVSDVVSEEWRELLEKELAAWAKSSPTRGRAADVLQKLGQRLNEHFSNSESETEEPKASGYTLEEHNLVAGSSGEGISEYGQPATGSGKQLPDSKRSKSDHHLQKVNEQYDHGNSQDASEEDDPTSLLGESLNELVQIAFHAARDAVRQGEELHAADILAAAERWSRRAAKLMKDEQGAAPDTDLHKKDVGKTQSKQQQRRNVKSGAVKTLVLEEQWEEGTEDDDDAGGGTVIKRSADQQREAGETSLPQKMRDRDKIDIVRAGGA
ncbi:hypothetical protein DFS34DRAFT_640733 [Phlyctochytrium arcticum]|nr:hypothetical protein DFS34DRAFT_640733 [Phlyctochytrium arcticum]